VAAFWRTSAAVIGSLDRGAQGRAQRAVLRADTGGLCAITPAPFSTTRYVVLLSCSTADAKPMLVTLPLVMLLLGLLAAGRWVARYKTGRRARLSARMWWKSPISAAGRGLVLVTVMAQGQAALSSLA